MAAGARRAAIFVSQLIAIAGAKKATAEASSGHKEHGAEDLATPPCHALG